jgi:dethiobiotin synthetase
MKGFFVTGTDTGVGKTVISGGLIKVLNFMGLKTAGMKPVESGCIREGDILIPSDGSFLKQMAHMPGPITEVTPCCFENPLAPLAASELEKKNISISGIKKAFYSFYREYDAVIAEGVGGLLVPLKKDYFVLDLAKEMGLPLIVVAKPGLGTINHTMLTVDLALKEGLTVAGVVINYSSPPQNNLAEETNPGILKEICPVPLIGIFPYLENCNYDLIEKIALKALDKDILRTYL